MDAIYSAQEGIKKDLGLSKVKVIHNQNYQRHGTKSYVYLLNRFGFKPTKPGPYFHVDKVDQHGFVPEQLKGALGGTVHTSRTLVKRFEKDGEETGQVTAEDQQNDSMYICKVGIGSPPQNLLLDFDTGSADTWVFSTLQDKSTQSGHNVYNPKKSKTFKKLSGKSWQIQYGDGSTASGDCVSDTLEVGGLVIKKQTIECATKMSQQFSKSTSDGLLGLAWGKINTVTDSAGEADPQATPVENMIKQEDIPKESELFTSAFYSTRDKDNESFYTFGFIDQDLVKKSGQDIHWTDIDNSQGFWAVSSESCTVNGEKIDLNGNTAIADTGTTLALMSDEVVEKIYDQIPGATYDWLQQGYTFPINVKLDNLPELKVAVGDAEYVIQKEDLAFSLTDDKQSWYGGVQSRGEMPFDILGDTFLKSVYAVWDQGNRRLGLVPKIEATQNLEPPPDSDGDGGEKKKIHSIDLLADDLAEPADV
ncbi:aspartic endopeptidase [Hypoxylon rubiginosum]|uniref:Aspartic endopeptidase n=1 Tax=Hypoxylon rubiginosum TaxID=110542 RepID=A0ACC0DBB8_9PEZI|nr:aspartic endopeptidase [Hypoxylon rubiginosum]